MFFDENGMFRLDEMVVESKTFQKIMEDEIVTDEEIREQSLLVVELYKRLEKSLNAEQLKLVAETIVEMGVLQSACQYAELKELKGNSNR